ncbi:MAG: hypothetical protein M3Y40_04135 [Chloroflexota bacterium]|nr:hypothetical protein [Chloroflexota bacterium]
MRTDHDLERTVRLWVAHGSDQLPEPALDGALNEIANTKQRPAGWLARRINVMNGNGLKLGAAAVVIVAAAILGGRWLMDSVGGPPDPTPTSTTTATLASGSFTAPLGEFGEAFDIEASRRGDDVSGTMEISDPVGGEGAYSVDVQCARSTDDGTLMIGGEVTQSTYEEFIEEGAYVVIALAPGTPVRMLWAVDVLATDEVPAPAESCSAFVESWLGDPEFVQGLRDNGRPIEGELELGS